MHTDFRRIASVALVVLAVVYGFLAPFHTVDDFDTGWQLASGRYIVHQHHIPSVDALSYTATGREWIYPPAGGVLLYFVYATFGYAGLSWLCALVGALTMMLCMRQRTLLVAALAIVAVPSIAYRITPRAELFTTVLFAAFFSLLWSHYGGTGARLWLLPILMACWVNLHPGFIAGLAAIGAYVFLELAQLAQAGDRLAAIRRLKCAWPWLVTCLAATLINPWGPKIYAVLLRQNRAMELHSAFIGEWSRVPLSAASLRQAFNFRNPDSSFWWLAAIAIIAAILMLLNKKLAVSALLLGSVYVAFEHIRTQGLFAIVTVIVVSALPMASRPWLPRVGELRHRLRPLAYGAAAVLTLVTFVRIADLASNRAYVMASSTALFGPGESWWFPERAAAFIEQQHLPGKIFHDYNTGGFLTLRLPEYPDYIDGRAIPFGADQFIHYQELLGAPPDSSAWAQESEKWNINIVLLPLARFAGLDSVDLQAWCHSSQWQPVYLDEVSAVFVRRQPQNAPWLERLNVDCGKQKLEPQPALRRADLFNFYANYAAILFVRGRDQESWNALDEAQRIVPYDPGIPLTRGQLLQAHARFSEAEQQYRMALSRKQSDAGWSALGNLYFSIKKYDDAADAFEHAAALSATPYRSYYALAQIELLRRQPDSALRALREARRQSPFRGTAEALGRGFYAQLDDIGADAYQMKGDIAKAIASERRAVDESPSNAAGWRKLAGLYRTAGDNNAAAQAEQRADQLTPPSAH